MKKIINGKSYDTDTARELAEYWNGYGRSDFRWTIETLYIKKTGEYFLFGQGGPMTKYSESSGGLVTNGKEIFPLTLKEAKEWAEENIDGDTYEKIFGEVEEEEDVEQQQQFAVLLPVTMLDNLKKKKAETGINISALIKSALRDAGL